MTPLDAMFLDAEDGDPHASMAIASLAVMDGPAPAAAELVRTIAGRLPLVPRYRQRAMRVPLNLSQPVWVDDPDFDLSYHVRTTALPAPGDDGALCRLVARLMSQRLDRERPLWEYWCITGLAEGRWAILSKVHHCLVDGVGGNQLYRLIFDESATPGAPATDTWQAAPPPNALELTVEAASQLARARVAQLEQLALAMLRPKALNQYLADTARGLAALSGSLRPLSPSSLAGPIGRARRYSVARVPFVDLRAASKAHQVTINDVVLAAVTRAFRELLVRRGESPRPNSIRAMVPVSVRAPSASSAIDNRVSMLLPELPVHLADPVERLRVVHANLVALKASKEAEASAALNAASAYEPFPLVSWAFRAAARTPQENVITVATNVPGPATQLYLLGRPVLEILPYVPIAGRMRLGVSVMTYRGQAVFGVTGDYHSAPEVDAFAADIAAGVAELGTARVGSTSAGTAVPIAKQAVASSAVPTKAVPTKAVPTKAVPTKAVAKQATAKQAVAKKAIAKKTMAKQAVPKRTAPTTAVAKQAVAKTAIAKKAIAKKAVAKKAMARAE